MANMLNQSRRSYQPNVDVPFGQSKRPFAGPIHLQLLAKLDREVIGAANATTQAAYLLRLNAIRAIVKQL